MIYQVDETTIPISVILLKNNGTPETGKNALLYLYDDNLAQIIVNGASLTEGPSGYYKYSWVHGQTENKTFTYYIIEAGSVRTSGKIRIVTNIQELTNTIDLADGQAI